MEQSIGVRRNIQALSKPQRQQYFWCLKMLGILPPFKALKQRYMWTLGTTGPQGNSLPFNQMQPKCLHDELIANHGSCCQHSSIFFGYYHRHLIFHLQMRLNYVDQCLRLTPQQFGHKFPQLFNVNRNLWQQILFEYKELVPQKKKVMSHYWNPTNYNNRDDLVIPVELADPQLYPHQLDKVDELYNLVRGSYPFQVNVRTRWYNEPHQLDRERDNFMREMYQNGYFYQNYQYSQQEQQIQRGDYNPRNNRNFSEFYQDYIRMNAFSNNNYPSSFKKTGNRNLDKFMQTGDKMNLYYQTQGQVLSNYGGRFGSGQKQYNMHYFNQNELSGNSFYDTDKVNYNKMLPHYQLAYALLNQKFTSLTQYIDPAGQTLESSHNTMHNAMHFSMIDGNFSLMNLMFFPYHSWIDIQLEMKIRMCHNPREGYRMYRAMMSRNQRTQHFDPILNPKRQTQFMGAYPIMEWADPKFVNQVYLPNRGNFQAQVDACQRLGLNRDSVKLAFQAGFFLLRNPNELRTSVHLKQFYDMYYIYQHVYLFGQFNGFKTYDASYDIQIFETVYDENTRRLQNKTYMLGDYPNVNIPSYLTAMRDQVNGYIQDLRSRIKVATKVVSAPREVRHYEKLVNKGLLLLVKYKTSIPNGTYILSANLEKLSKMLLDRGHHLSNQQMNFLRGDITLVVLPLFGTSKNAHKCINCGQVKYKIIDMSQQLYDRYHRLWSLLNNLLLQEIIYDSRDHKKKKTASLQGDSIDINKFLSINMDKNLMELDYIQGAEEVQIDVTYLSDTPKVQQFNLELDVATERVQNNDANSVVMKEIKQKHLKNQGQDKGRHVFTYKFEFYNIVDNHSELDRNELDGLVYRKVTANIYADGLAHQASFRIRHYHETVHYQMTIEKEQGQLVVKVVDADFKTKQQLFKVQ